MATDASCWRSWGPAARAVQPAARPAARRGTRRAHRDRAGMCGPAVGPAGPCPGRDRDCTDSTCSTACARASACSTGHFPAAAEPRLSDTILCASASIRLTAHQPPAPRASPAARSPHPPPPRHVPAAGTPPVLPAAPPCAPRRRLARSRAARGRS